MEEAIIGIGSALGVLAGCFGFMRFRTGRNGGGTVRLHHKDIESIVTPIVTAVGEVKNVVDEVRTRQIGEEKWREGYEAAKREG